jgi:hypothetical protein
MDKRLEIAGKVLLVGATAYIIAKVYKQVNDGVGLFLSQEKMGEYVMTSKYGSNRPITKEQYYAITKNADGVDVSFKYAWQQYDKEYATAFYKAVWRATKGNGSDTFKIGDKEYYTKGGLLKKA